MLDAIANNAYPTVKQWQGQIHGSSRRSSTVICVISH